MNKLKDIDLILNELSLGVLKIHRSGDYYLNPRALSFLGDSAPEGAELQELFNRIHPEDIESVRTSNFYRFCHGRGTNSMEESIQLRIHNGQQVKGLRIRSVSSALSLTASLEEISEGEFLKNAGVERDLSFRESLTMHEAKNLISVLRLFLDKKKRQSNVQTEISTVGTKDLDFLLEVVKKLTEIISQQMMPGPLEEDEAIVPIKIHKIITEALAVAKEDLSCYEISVKTSIPPELEVMCRPTKFFQILLNLIFNAAQAIGHVEEKWIYISATVEEQNAKISIKDSGKGIEKQVLDKMFSPYFTTKKDGTGLGLFISKKIALENQGDLNFNETSDNTEFILTLPVR